MNSTLNELRIDFSADSLILLNVLLAFIMFGIALEIKFSDFRLLWREPRPVLAGVISQFIILPALTFGLVYLIQPRPAIALGMIMVAACPGGNISNFISHLSGANAALSVSLTGAATLLSLFFTPFNLEFWGSLYPPTAEILRSIAMNPAEIFKTVLLILIVPLSIGMALQYRFSSWANRLAPYFKVGSVLIFMGFVVVAFAKNGDVFTQYIQAVFWLVLLHNALAFLAGYGSGRLAGASQRDCRTMAIETGIQNSGLGLLLIFTFFDGLGGMALTAAWWGVWHLITGLGVALVWGRFRKLSPGLS